MLRLSYVCVGTIQMALRLESTHRSHDCRHILDARNNRGESGLTESCMADPQLRTVTGLKTPKTRVMIYHS